MLAPSDENICFLRSGVFHESFFFFNFSFARDCGVRLVKTSSESSDREIISDGAKGSRILVGREFS